MAALSPANTPRFRINYNVNTKVHDFQIRSAGSPGSVGTAVDAFLTALATNLFGLTVQTVEFAATGSNVFIPVTSGIEGNVYGGGVGNQDEIPNFIGFVGRSAAGKKWKLAVNGTKVLGGNYRFVAGENTVVDNAIAALNAYTGLIAIDGAAVTVYTYANAGRNAHWQRAIR
jgi:hypothetical protein